MSYRKGASAERELIHLLKQKGFNSMRVAGSRGAVDVISLYKGKAYIFQVKYTKYDSIRVRRREVRRLVDLYYRHNPNPDKETTAVYLAVKFRKHGWRFYPVVKLWALLSGVFDTFELKPRDGLPFDSLFNWLDHQIST